jgi:hypothetical protein
MENCKFEVTKTNSIVLKFRHNSYKVIFLNLPYFL